MIDELKSCLSLYLPEEVYSVYLDAYRVLNEIGLSDQDTELLNIMGIGSEESDSYLVTGRIEACLTYGVGGQLNEYGVIVMDGTPLTVMTKILEAVATFERYHIPEAVSDIFLTEEFDDEEAFSEFVSLFSDLEPVDTIEYLSSIKHSTIERIKLICTEELSTRVNMTDEVPNRRERSKLINHIERSSPEKHLHVVRKVADYGYPMNVNVDSVLDDVVDLLDGITEPQQMSLEILALIVYTDEDYLTSYRTFVDDYADTEHLTSRLLRQIETFLKTNGYLHAQA